MKHAKYFFCHLFKPTLVFRLALLNVKPGDSLGIEKHLPTYIFSDRLKIKEVIDGKVLVENYPDLVLKTEDNSITAGIEVTKIIVNGKTITKYSSNNVRNIILFLIGLVTCLVLMLCAGGIVYFLGIGPFIFLICVILFILFRKHSKVD